MFPGYFGTNYSPFYPDPEGHHVSCPHDNLCASQRDILPQARIPRIPVPQSSNPRSTGIPAHPTTEPPMSSREQQAVGTMNRSAELGGRWLRDRMEHEAVMASIGSGQPQRDGFWKELEARDRDMDARHAGEPMKGIEIERIKKERAADAYDDKSKEQQRYRTIQFREIPGAPEISDQVALLRINDLRAKQREAAQDVRTADREHQSMIDSVTAKLANIAKFSKDADSQSSLSTTGLSPRALDELEHRGYAVPSDLEARHGNPGPPGERMEQSLHRLELEHSKLKEDFNKLFKSREGLLKVLDSAIDSQKEMVDISRCLEAENRHLKAKLIGSE